MKKLLKNEFYGSINSARCALIGWKNRKVKLCDYCSLNNVWTVAAVSQTRAKKKKKKKGKTPNAKHPNQTHPKPRLLTILGPDAAWIRVKNSYGVHPQTTHPIGDFQTNDFVKGDRVAWNFVGSWDKLTEGPTTALIMWPFSLSWYTRFLASAFYQAGTHAHAKVRKRKQQTQVSLQRIVSFNFPKRMLLFMARFSVSLQTCTHCFT